jgi:GR25 family glycosyltransferase involved in LPS biosynthesis
MSNNIDKIFYINLNKRTDRRLEIENELNNFGLSFERFEAIETSDFGIYGCGLSHLGVLKISKERGYKNVLILEDDFTFLVSKEEFENNLTKFFESEINYDVCKLAYNLHEFQEINNETLGKIVYSATASAYIVNNHYFEKLINLYEWALPLLNSTKCHWIYANDQIWKDYQKQDNWYYFKIRIGKQRPSYSDNGQSFTDYNV